MAWVVNPIRASQGLRIKRRCSSDADIADDDLKPMVDSDPAQGRTMAGDLFQSPTDHGGRLPLPQERARRARESQGEEDESESETTPDEQGIPS